MKTYTLEQVQDKLIGKIGTPERDIFEYELQIYPLTLSKQKLLMNFAQ
mgnify:CR=1 FL=1